MSGNRHQFHPNRSRPSPLRPALGFARIRRPGVRKCVLIGVLVLFLGAAWHYWTLYRSLDGAHQDVTAAQETLRLLTQDMSDEQLDEAALRLDSARAHVDTASRHMRWDPLLRVAPALPWVGPNVSAAQRLVTIADLLVAVGDEAVVLGERFTDARTAGTGDTTTEAVVHALQGAENEMQTIDRLLARVVAERESLGDDDLVGPLERAVERLDGTLPSVLNSVDLLDAGRRTIPGMLGFEGERRYLVLAVNNGELLPGGGLVTASGVLAVDQGRTGDVEFVDSVLWRRQWLDSGGHYIEPPGPLKRYLLRDLTWNLLVSNWSPDFPTWSQEALRMYEMVHGEQGVDGVVAVDLVALERLLALVGPVSLPVGERTVTFNAENAVIELERLTRSAAEPGGDRKSIIGDLTSVVLSKVQQLPAERWPDLVGILNRLAEGGHLQVTSFDPEEQEAIELMGADGRLEPGAVDYLMVNESSVLGTKLSLVMERAADHEIEFGDDGLVHHTLRLTLRNALAEWSAGRDPGLVEALMGNGVYGAYLRIFVPQTAGGFALDVDGEPAAFEDVGEEAGLAWVGVFQPIPDGETAEVTFRWHVPVTGAVEDYELRLQKQPGLRRLCSNISLRQAGTPLAVRADGHGLLDSGEICLSGDTRIEPVSRTPASPE